VAPTTEVVGELVADCLDEAAGQLGVELRAQREVDAELEALRTSAARVWDLELDSADWPSSLVASMSTAVELLEGQIDATTDNRVRWGVLLCIGCCHVTFPRAKPQAGATRVCTQNGPNRG
jgi:hypothetical protein